MSRFLAPSETSNAASTPVPFSPFSTTSSIASDFTATSEEPADLGAFSTIFRALTQLQRPNAPGVSSSDSDSPSSSAQTPSASPFTYATTDLPPDTTEDESDARHFRSSSSSSSFSPSEAESDAYISDIFGFAPSSARRAARRSSNRDSKRGGTVWNEDPVASYLSPAAQTDQADDDLISPIQIPSLGAFESALSFLAGERARLTTKLERDTNASNTSYNSPIMPGHHSPPVFPITSTEPSPIATSSKQKKKQNRKGRKERERIRTENGSAAAISNSNHLEVPAYASSSYDSPPSSEERQSRILGRTGNGNGAEPILRRLPASPNNKKSKRSSRQAGSYQEETATGLSDTVAAEDLAPVNDADTMKLRAHLLSMASRLSEQFPADGRLLASLPFDLDRFTAAGGFIPREEVVGADGASGYWDGSATSNDKGKVHVFIDHSNILVGFLTWIEREFRGQRRSSNISIAGITTTVPSATPRKPKLSHASLALLFERGRRIGKRVIVASSPTYQPLDDMHDMGYEVSVLQRVAIKEGGATGGASTPVGNSAGATAEHPKGNKLNGGRPQRSDRRDSLRSSIASSTGTGGSSSLGTGPGTANSFDGSGGSSTESGNLPSASANFILQHQSTPLLGLQGYQQSPPVSSNNKRNGHRRFPSAPSVLSPSSTSLSESLSLGGTETSTPLAGSPGAGTPTSRPRYREEAVDELLQLKILQVLIEAPAPAPRGSTIVLATGDGASSQFNRDGFLGCVRMAVQRGWRVELVGWEGGRSRAWGELANELKGKKQQADRNGVRQQGGLYMINLDNWGWDIYDSRTSA